MAERNYMVLSGQSTSNDTEVQSGIVHQYMTEGGTEVDDVLQLITKVRIRTSDG
jgi:hypothetical protein